MDGNGNIIDSSNDGVVTMNNSATGPTSHGGVVYVMIMQASWTSVDYNIRFWTWMPGGTNANQNDFGYLNYDLPDTLIDLQSDSYWPSEIIGAAPISSGIINAEFDYYSGDNDDWMSFAISSLEGFALEISYNQYSYNTSGAVINDFSITMYDANFNIISASSGNNPEIVTTNNSAAGPGGHGGTIYIHIQRNSGMGTYDIQLWTWILSGGGGNTVTGAIPTMNNITNVSIEMVGLVIGNNYQYEYNELFTDQVNLTNLAVLNNYGPYSFTATATTETFNHSLPGPTIEGDYGVDVYLRDASGSLIGYGGDFIYYEMLEIETTSSNTGDIYASNLTIGAPYTIQWIVFSADAVEDFLSANPTASIDDALNASIVDGNLINFTANTATYTDQVSWNSPTTMYEHTFVAVLYPQGANTSFSTGNGYLGTHIDDFIPQLPSSIITSYSFSISAATNDFSVEGSDLIPGDLYYHQFRVEDSNGADINYSSITTTTATAQNMSFGTFYYQTPTVSGQFCLFSDLYDANFVQIVGDSVCLVYVFDDDSDGVPNESDLCPNTQPGSFVDNIGCASSQKDFDGDGYNDDIDDFPYDDTQWLDTDGDGFGDNINGNYPDAFPTDNTQWSDTDGDGYGDNLNGNYPDAFPLDATQWSDNDGDGYGDNSGGNNPDLWPADPSQWTDSDGDGYGDNPQGTAGDAFPFDGTQWNDWDNDGHGDNANGNNPDLFPNDGTQWADADGDGYGDNLNGNNADKFPSDPTQWFDSDGDGYGDNQQGNNPDAFPSDNTQWIDEDGDGYGDNQNGNYPDKFPQDSSQWQDNDFDGFGDNVNGNNPDLCLNTPLGEIVDANGCSTSQTDSDQDGVYDMNDGCANTPAGEYVNSNGCSETQLDDDRDGVANQFDLCSSTPLNAVVNSAGCANIQLDSDNDGINNSLDSCPATNPGSSVDGFGCAPNQRDMDADGVNDNLDVCPNTPISEIATNNGCSESQIDSDMDGVFNDVDQCPNTTLLDLNSDGEFDIDSVGCSPTQYDDDSDMIDNTVDLCPATPTDEQVNIDGCSNSQLDEDNDDIWNSNDLCFDTPAGQPVDQNGCSDEQKDDDQDGMMNSVDQCPNTPVGEIINDNGCSLTQLDTDNDGVNDLEDAFPFDSNESVDTDSDGVPDRLDAYPQDAFRSKSEVGDKNNGFVFILRNFYHRHYWSTTLSS